MALALFKPWRTQPTGQAGIDWSNPYTQNLKFAYCGSMGFIDLVSKQIGVTTGADATKIVNMGTLGPAVAFSGTRITNGGIYFGVIQPVKNNLITALAIANPASANRAEVLFSQRVGTGNVNQFELAVNTSFGLGASAGKFSALTYNNTLTRDSVSSASTFTNSRFNVYAATVSSVSSFPILYFNGRSVSVSTSGTLSSSWYSNTQKTHIGNIADWSTDATYAAQCEIPLCLVWDRVLSAAEIAVISANPWQLFRPLELQLGPGVTSAFPTLSNARMTSLTSTQGVPNVDYAF